VTRRYVAGVVRRARDDILSAIVRSRPSIEPMALPLGTTPDGHLDFKWSPVSPTPERLERAVNGGTLAEATDDMLSGMRYDDWKAKYPGVPTELARRVPHG
jgi:hypothetical protein